MNENNDVVDVFVINFYFAVALTNAGDKFKIGHVKVTLIEAG